MPGGRHVSRVPPVDGAHGLRVAHGDAYPGGESNGFFGLGRTLRGEVWGRRAQGLVGRTILRCRGLARRSTGSLSAGGRALDRGRVIIGGRIVGTMI